jgi:hypothetical protein
MIENLGCHFTRRLIPRWSCSTTLFKIRAGSTAASASQFPLLVWSRNSYVTGLVNQELLLQNEYLGARVGAMRLSNPERSTLAEIGKRLGRKVLAQVACVAGPDTILAWYRRLIASKFDGSKHRSYPGRPRIAPEIESLIVQMVRENHGWEYDRIVGALANLGRHVSDQTVGNALWINRPSGAKTRVGGSSSSPTWRFWPGSTSSRWKCTPGGVW